MEHLDDAVQSLNHAIAQFEASGLLDQDDGITIAQRNCGVVLSQLGCLEEVVEGFNNAAALRHD